jgi:predicted metal-dependent phosphoesterase TrpH
MKTKLRRPAAVRGLLVAAAAVLALLAPSGGAAPETGKKWYKGNLHTHTVHSDGDSTPNEVASWYKEHRYHFLVLSDHNYLTEIAGLNAVFAAPERFLLIQGEEVTTSSGGKPVHVNAYHLDRLVDPVQAGSVAATVQANVNAIRAARALPSLNHPNFEWAVTSKDLLQVSNLNLFEVYNGHPSVNNRGGGGAESLEEMWDALLTGGKRIHGIAVDDAHNFKTIAKTLSNPGRGWIMVRAERLSDAAIRAAIEAGDFYASSGVGLSDVRVAGGVLRIDIDAAPSTRYSTFFIGEGGKVLKRAEGNNPEYRFEGSEKYVRARVQASTGDDAWVQPVFR